MRRKPEPPPLPAVRRSQNDPKARPVRETLLVNGPPLLGLCVPEARAKPATAT